MLTLYYRAGCSLCEAMLEELQPFLAGQQAQLNLVDIDSSAELVQQFGERVPVLRGEGGVEICHYFLDPGRLRDYLASC